MSRRLDVESIRDEIEDDIQRKVLSRTRLTTKQRVAVRKVMSNYWDNSSPFSINLVGAVIRQGTFIEKMHSIDWIHSPAVASTMNRLIQKYARFFEILASYPKRMAVPTLDVDLAWRKSSNQPTNEPC